MSDSEDSPIQIINSKEIAEAIKKRIEENPEFKPAILTVEDPNAIYVEFGTRPASKTGARGNSTAYNNIRHWAENKKEVKQGDKRSTDEFAYRVYKDIMENGMIPQPFFRPAIHSLEEEIKSHPSRFNGMGPTHIAEILRDDMVEILRTNKTPFEFRIDESIIVRTVMKPEDIPEGQEIVPDYIMKSDTLDVLCRDRSGERKWRGKK